ncbi:MAG: polysaccharide biosynthesis/export family protein [Gammaproteobacteria bacterium]|nr:polysaccharide biosynthesis/export family protein [Gammaproteobacteria bacterium]MBK7168686.1 polysaccharide biosynthesis/export family protein [Gammaproteobacteria bacterium]MBK7520247.1 polysaccharide biosynthesis/export family protein [Gammaproteobacteria bacterium]MBK9667114.1 polysaccharide biosynthesis/export family protein [Gammaproteobacteria bacterium]MBP6480711.1 polysaccharide biosynthesis/export family protein [Pseudomonadales bacterium]
MPRLITLVLLAWLCGPAFAADYSPFDLSQTLGLSAPAAEQAPPRESVPPEDATAPGIVANSAPAFDYSVNLNSNVFGAQLFTGSFARVGATQFNPDYVVATGDQIQIRLWGGFDFDSLLLVDPKGNLFLPHVGPIKVLGVRNEDLQRVVESAVARVFRANVYSYASLAAAQPVRIFVGGFVNRPGLYNGTSMDSLLHYLDQAGGIDAERGSFLAVQVKRGETVRAEVNLYDFLLDGRMPLVQLADGDVIFVKPRRNSVLVTGMAQNANRFEFADGVFTVGALSRLAKPQPQANHVRVVRNTGSTRNVEYYALEEAQQVTLFNGDELAFTADKKQGTITVRVEGEHQSAQEYVLPYGARMGELLGQIQFSERSDEQSIQLFRLSVKDRQKQMLQTALKSLEAAALTARSGTSDEARLRKDEAELLLQWVDRARAIEPLGQVLIAGASQRDELLLENGDLLRVPTRDGLVLVSGEVLFPNAIAFDEALDLGDYVLSAGGYTQNADLARVVVAHRDGSFNEATGKKSLFRSGPASAEVRAGDEILVLPKIDVKSRQIWKDLTQIMYQIAVSAKVVVDI